MSSMAKFNLFQAYLQRSYPFEIKYKNESLFMKILSYILFFNKTFMTNYITTIGNSIYFPSKEFIQNDEESAITILAHEVVHVKQSEDYGRVLFSLLYLFPQCLALFAFLSVLAVFWLPFLWCLCFLVFLAPIPAPWRTKFELEAYGMSMYMMDLQMRRLEYPDDQREKELALFYIRINNKQFKGPAYWFMWPFGVDADFEKKINDIQSGVISDTSDTYARVKRAYENALSTL